MTVQQLQYVLEIAKTGSVSQAARNLFLSQPNISSALKSLERELGFAIFYRTNTGMVLTPEGTRLAHRADDIMQLVNQLRQDITGKQRYVFSLNCSSYVPAFEAFTDLCKKYQDKREFQLSCFSNSPGNSMRAMRREHYDLSVVILPAQYVQTARALKDLRFELLLETPLFIQISKSHPLAKEGAFSMEALRRYPYVDFVTADDNIVSTTFLNFVNPDRLIRVQSLTSRRDIVVHTNAFSAVLPHSREYNEQYGLVNIPVPEIELAVGYFCWAGRQLSAVARDYLVCLKERLKTLG